MNRQCDKCGEFYDESRPHRCLDRFDAAVDSARSELLQSIQESAQLRGAATDITDAIEVLIEARIAAALAEQKFGR